MYDGDPSKYQGVQSDQNKVATLITLQMDMALYSLPGGSHPACQTGPSDNNLFI